MPLLHLRDVKKTVSYLAFCFLIFISCSGPLNKKQFIQWVEDYKNGLHVQKATDEFIFDLQYQPPQYLLLQRNGNEKSANDTDDLQHYLLTISMREKTLDLMDYGIHDLSEKQRKLYYFSYQFQNDIHIEENGKVLPCILFHFERQADLKLGRVFVMAFEKTKELSDETYIVINSEQFGSLPIKIKISKKNIPALKL